MKLLVLGSNSVVGHMVGLYSMESGHDVLGYDDSPSPLFNSVTANLHDTKLLKECIEDGDFNAVINCTAVVNEFAEQNKAEASFVNVYIPHYLAEITSESKTIIVHRSTDCIFSGKHGHYRICDMPDAVSFYARTKAIGELLNSKDITIRTSLVGPDLNSDGSGLFNWFMRQTDSINGFTRAIWTGLSTLEFAKEILILLEMRAHGLLQCVPLESINKYDLLNLFAKVMRLRKQVIPVEGALVDKSLVRFVGDFQFETPSYVSMMTQMAEWILDHKYLYPHYFK